MKNAYAGRVGYYPINRLAGHIIKTEEDLRIAEALMASTRRKRQMESKHNEV